MTGTMAWLLVMLLNNLLAETSGQTPPQGFRYASYEVTIPRKLSIRYGQEEIQDVSYLLQIEGKSQVVHLRQKKGIVPKHFPIFTYNEGNLQVDYPFIRDDCFYSGFIQGNPNSSATITTCSGGLKGVFQLENKTFEIHPAQASATFQHVVYQLSVDEDVTRMRCGLTEKEQSHQEAMIREAERVVVQSAPAGRWWPHIRYAKVAIVVSHEQYAKFNNNQTDTALTIFYVIHTANEFYEPLGLQISLVGLEIWSEKDLITISDRIGATLHAFNAWRRDTLLTHLKNDVAHLFMHKDFGQRIGLAYVNTICSDRWASAVQTLKSLDLNILCVTFAHELGHTIGLTHDAANCKCDRRRCIMDATAVNTDKFSNCSYEEYYTNRNKGCLLIPPEPDQIYKFEICGNKVVEKGEQCDCGTNSQCEMDPCCQPNCMLRPGANCASGQCCVKCQYHAAGYTCRGNISVCDLAEYCSGASEQCPEDVYVQDGAPCSDGAYCYHGHCTTHNAQCKAIFGKDATVGAESCYKILNAQGDRFGNCGFRRGRYVKCNADNTLCGRIHCDNIRGLPSLAEHSTLIQTFVGDTKCWSTDYHKGLGRGDIGAVKDGTPCGTDMMCIDSECKNVSLLKYDCNVSMCNNRGICNNHKHCHCNYGWAPPDCLKEGYGGSIESGPTAKDWSGIVMGTFVGSVLFVSVATLGVSMALYYRIVLRNHLRRMTARISTGGETSRDHKREESL
ncbi:disintegrin and metalloproteinase domain-containing protein 20-like [Podarcis raffonei]|uniref:disintegrin and metalloproteinase domain-containing protein 20-like n=1 Tax=Podarcis raffonei TaxID=65483 RepID=UPI0023295CF7|nr:disintegrin and metalloproteinase domain-containing protein 20-like [Podarcis raffonei]